MCEAGFGWERELAQQAGEQLVQEGLAFRVDGGEFNAHFLAGDAVADDGFGHDHAARDFEDEGEFFAHAEGDGAAEGEASEAEGLDPRDLLLAAAVPGHGHAFGQANARVPPGDMRCFGRHGQGNFRSWTGRMPIGQMYLRAKKVKTFSLHG